jgi:hypothetical protein
MAQMKAKFKAYLESVNEEEKALTLSRLVNNLTICGRAQYGEEGVEERLRTINEMMHLASGKLRDVLIRTSKQYPMMCSLTFSSRQPVPASPALTGR